MEQHSAAPTTQSPAGLPVRALDNLGAEILENSNAWVAREVEWFLALRLRDQNVLGPVGRCRSCRNYLRNVNADICSGYEMGTVDCVS